MNTLLKPFTAVLSILLCVVFIVTTTSTAQTGNEVFRHITSRDGLQNTFVWEMIQDRHGFIWIAGASGLDRYDGYTVTNFRNDPENESSITGGIAFTLFEDDQGFIWIGTGMGLSVFNPADETFIQVQLDEALPSLRGVRSLKKTENGSVWAGTSNGLFYIPKQNMTSAEIEAEHFDLDSEEFSISDINSIETGDTDYIWLGTNTGVLRFDIITRELSRPGPFNDTVDYLLTRQVWTLHKDRNQNLWISTFEGFGVWNHGDDEPQVVTSLGDGKLDLTGQYMQSIVETRDGDLWVGTGDIGAFKFNPVTRELYAVYRHESGNTNTISEDDVHYVFEDIDGNVWFGYHFVGMSVMYTQPWNYQFIRISDEFDGSHSLNFTHASVADESGNLWITTHRGLVNLPADGSPKRNFLPVAETADYDSLDNQLVFIFKEGQHIITNSHSGNYYLFDLSEEQFHKLEIPEGISPYHRAVNGANHYLLGTVGGNELLQIDKRTFSVTAIEIPLREPDDSQQRVVIPVLDAEENIYVKYFHFDESIDWDIYSFDEVSEELTRIVLSAPDNIMMWGTPFTSPHEPGVVWMRTNRGLLREDLINLTSRLLFQAESGLIRDAIPIGIEDKDGNIWFGSSAGILRLNPETEVLTLYEADLERRPTGPFFFPNQLPDGNILLMGYGGYTRFNPDELTDNPEIRNIHITELRTGEAVFNTLYGTGDYEIDYRNNNLSFSFLGLNYRDPAMTRYRYRLTGYQDDWIDVGTQRRIFLANLPPGNYSFQVQAGQRYGSYSDDFAEIQFAILPPWWRTLPAYFFFMLIFAGGVFAVDRIQRRRLLAKERERTREKELEQAREIEKAYENLKAAQEQLVQQEKLASLGQLTAGIAHEIKNPLNFVNNFSEVSLELVEEAREEVRRVTVDGGSESVKVVNPLSRGDGIAEGDARGVSDGVESEGESRNTDEESSADNTPLNPLSRGDLLLEILEDIEANLRKIHEHGSRADGIVKSMLLHSRGGDGSMEPTDLNALVKEYVNLAFHGMRAGKDPINVDIQLELEENVGEVPLIAEDFSRVILNLCNNAFDAMRSLGAERLAQSESYSPKLTVSTKSENNQIFIEVQDNGPGIPDEIKDKILQPFFTTKKGTQGTGLGLSITNDIVKAHGGNLDIHSRPGKTVLKITLIDTTNA